MSPRPRPSQPAAPQRGVRLSRGTIELCGFKAGLDQPSFLRGGRRGLGGRGAPGAGSGAGPADVAR